MGKPAKKNRTSSRSKARSKAKAASARPDTSQASRGKAGSHGNGHLSQARELTVYECWAVCKASAAYSVWVANLMRGFYGLSALSLREIANEVARVSAR